MQLASEKYLPRPIWHIGVRRIGERACPLKIYGISKERGAVPDGVVDAALAYITTLDDAGELLLPHAETTQGGFVILHAGEQAMWLQLCLWSLDILHIHTHHAPVESPERFRASMVRGSAACVWELQIVAHEREAWISHVLSRPQAPDFAAYEECVLDA